MEQNSIPFFRTLAGRMLLFGILPTGIILSVVIIITAASMANDLREQREETLRVLVERIAGEIELGNNRAILTTQIMAEAQVRGMFGDREASRKFAEKILLDHPEFTRATFGYEPNADDQDDSYHDMPAGSEIKKALGENGRFLPYWSRDKNDNSKLTLRPLVDMETSLYYQGLKDLYIKEGRPLPMVAEPYVYEGKLVVEQTFPIIMDGKFVGISGIDRALSDIETFLGQIKADDSADIFLISNAGKFVATTLESDLQTLPVSESPYSDLLSTFSAEAGGTQLTIADDPLLGESSYFAVAPVPTGNWSVVVREPVDVVLWKKDNTSFPVEYSATPIVRGADELVGAVIAFRDITERREAEEALRTSNYLSDIALELTGCGYWHIDYSEPDFYYQSDRAATILGEPLKPDRRYNLSTEWFDRLVEADPAGAELISAEETNPIELVLMDWRMPDTDGLQATAIIRESDEIKYQPKIVMVTAYGNEALIAKAEQAGISGVLMKPISSSLLFDSIAHAFGDSIEAGDLPRSVETSTGPKDLRGIKLLLVEDNEINQEVAGELLRDVGIEFELAENGREAVEMATTGNFAGVLMDIQMPLLDGYEATLEIRKTHSSSKLPIIAMTANAMAGDREKALDCRMNDHIPKPIDPTQLYSTIRRWFREQETVSGQSPALTATQPRAIGTTGMPDMLDGIDIDSGLKRVAGNERLYHKILHKFRESHITSAEEISQALDLGDTGTAHRIAHTVKGVAGNLGADDLQAAAKQVDAAFKANDSDSVRTLLPAMELELLRVARAIDSTWPQAEEVPPPETVALDELDIPAVTAGLDKLESLLRNNDFEAQDTLDALASTEANSHLQEGVGKIAKQLGQYDFDRALEELLQLKQGLDS